MKDSATLIKAKIRELKREMKLCGIKRVSCFNAGLDNQTYRDNARLFALETELRRIEGRL